MTTIPPSPGTRTPATDRRSAPAVDPDTTDDREVDNDTGKKIGPPPPKVPVPEVPKPRVPPVPSVPQPRKP